MKGERERLEIAGHKVTLVSRSDRSGFWLDARVPGRGRIRRRVGETRRGAIREIRKLLDAPALEERDAPTVKQAAARMLRFKATGEMRLGSLEAMKSHLRKHILPALGREMPIDEVTEQCLADFREGLLELEISPHTINRILTTLTQLFKFAEEHRYCVMPRLPKRMPAHPEDNVERWHLLTPAKIEDLLSHVASPYRPALTYVANTGLRPGAALATERSWIDASEQRVRYPTSVLKQRRAFTQTMNCKAAEALRMGLASSPDERAFPFGYWTLRRRFDEAKLAAGLPDVTIKDLRHSFVSNLLDAGVPIHVVKDLVGHSSILVTQLYAHTDDAARQAAVRRVMVDSNLEVTPLGEVVPDLGTKWAPRRRTKMVRAGNPAESEGNLVGHLGLEPRANGLRKWLDCLES